MRSPRRISVVTGSRAEFGLLRSVIRAIDAHPDLQLELIATGTHLLPPALTIEEVKQEFEVHATIPMQDSQNTGRLADAASLGRGVLGFAEHYARHASDVVTVLGDRIEAFAAASAAAVGGIRVAHLHGGDRAEGVSDESLRHAISKLAHIHFPATPTSAHRLIAMGEESARIHVVGSPAIDGLTEIPPLPDLEFQKFGEPEIIVVLHPTGETDDAERLRAAELLQIAQAHGRVLVMHPNHDPGRNGIMHAIEGAQVTSIAHLHRSMFIGLLRRAKLLVGNSSAGLIEASAVPIRVINIGTRQAGRESPGNVLNLPAREWDYQTIDRAICESLAAPQLTAGNVNQPYGNGACGLQVAAILASLDLSAHGLHKRNSY